MYIQILVELLKLYHQNLIIIFEHIFTKINADSTDNIWVFKHEIIHPKISRQMKIFQQ